MTETCTHLWLGLIERPVRHVPVRGDAFGDIILLKSEK